MESLLMLGLAVAASVLVGGMSLSILSDAKQARETSRQRQQLRDDIQAAVIHSQPTWEQLVDICESDGFGPNTAYRHVRSLYREVIVGKNQELQPHKALLESYMLTHKKTEPFEGLPTETRVHLERVREALGNAEQMLDPLTSQIRELMSVYERDKRAQRRYTFWGFLFGLVGVVFAAYAYIFPVNPSSSGQASVPVTPSGTK